MAKHASSNGEIAAAITTKILNQLKEGVLPWRKPWDGARAGAPVLPRRVTGEAYRGVNALLLWSAAADADYISPYWLTFMQATKLGGRVRKGEHGQVIVYHGSAARLTKSDDGQETREGYRFLRSYVVFCADQIDNLPERFHPAATARSLMPIAAHEQWFERLEINRIQTRDVACYMPSKDAIGMPPLDTFDSAEDYAATLNHECVHATMAPHRVGRDMGARFNMAARAAEELVAEIGASFLGAHLSMPPHHIHDHASYIDQWMRTLADDKRAFLTAAAQAQRAVDWLLAKSPATTIGAEEGANIVAA